MKKIIVSFSLIFCFVSLFAQDNREFKSFNILAGLKYTPIDYIGGGIVGFSYKFKKFTFCLRNDISMSIAKDDSLIYFGINKYRIYNYLDIHYNFNEKISTSIGYGWISNKNQIHRLNNEFGYSVVSIGMHYLISQRIILELKGDIPFVEWNSPIDQNIAFPVSIGLIYMIK